MRLEITQRHIDIANAIRNVHPVNKNCYTCPVAQALLGLGYEEVVVRYGWGQTVAKGHQWTVLGNAWIRDWDHRETVYPVTLELEEAGIQ